MRKSLIIAGFLVAAGLQPAWAQSEAPKPGDCLPSDGSKEPLAQRTGKALKGQRPFHEALRHRNVRYAKLTRELDREGDLREQALADARLTRELDRKGDREEAIRDQQFQRRHDHEGVAGTADAVFARALDRADDQRQREVSSLTFARKHADLRRFRDLRGDVEELAVYQEERLELEDLRLQFERTYLADRDLNPRGMRRFQEREAEKAEDADSRADERRGDLEEERRDRNFFDGRTSFDDVEKELDRQLDQEEAEFDDVFDDIEDEEDRVADREDAEQDRLDEREEAKDEAADERQEERDEDRVQQELEEPAGDE